jgi:hypothetical protein
MRFFYNGLKVSMKFVLSDLMMLDQDNICSTTFTIGLNTISVVHQFPFWECPGGVSLTGGPERDGQPPLDAVDQQQVARPPGDHGGKDACGPMRGEPEATNKEQWEPEETQWGTMRTRGDPIEHNENKRRPNRTQWEPEEINRKPGEQRFEVQAQYHN